MGLHRGPIRIDREWLARCAASVQFGESTAAVFVGDQFAAGALDLGFGQQRQLPQLVEGLKINPFQAPATIKGHIRRGACDNLGEDRQLVLVDFLC